MENFEKKVSRTKRIIQIGFISFVVLSTLGYVYYPIPTLFLDVLVIWLTSRWAKKRGIKTTFTFKRKNK